MKKEYRRPKSQCIVLLHEEIMNATSELPMEGTTDSFDAKQRHSFGEEYTDDAGLFEVISF